MKRILSMSIALALTLVCDRAFNGGSLAVHVFAQMSYAGDWAARSGDEIATTFTGFRS